MQVFLQTVVVLGVVSCVLGQQKVSVKLSVEADCPGCRQLIGGNLKQTFAAQGVPEIMDFDYLPFGNAYYVMKECRGRPDAYECWVHHCAPWANAPRPVPQDCFNGTVVCQHGQQECWGNHIEQCAMHMLNNDPVKFMPFIFCFEQDPTSESKAKDCASSNGLDYNTLSQCASGDQVKVYQAAIANRTINIVGRDATPFMTINGQNFTDFSFLTRKICNEYTGPKPPGCH